MKIYIFDSCVVWGQLK